MCGTRTVHEARTPLRVEPAVQQLGDFVAGVVDPRVGHGGPGRRSSAAATAARSPSTSATSQPERASPSAPGSSSRARRSSSLAWRRQDIRILTVDERLDLADVLPGWSPLVGEFFA
jgi:hypothetical protein